ncbi:MAG: CsbD family protein [Bryobacteraceae bacterium]
MNWDALKGNWNQLKGSIKERWGRLTDDEITEISGRKDKLIGKLQEKYGMTVEEAEREASEWLSTNQPTGSRF